MVTKERLRNYRALAAEQRQIRGRLEELETRLYSPRSQQLTGMPHAPSKRGNATEELVATHAELQERYLQQLQALVDEQLAIEAAIAQLEPAERMVLRLRYMSGRTWEEIAVEMSYSWRQVHRIHKSALGHLGHNTMEE